MAISLINEVFSYLDMHRDVATSERLVLILIAERANAQTREAWSGGTDEWQLGRRSGLSPTGLRKVYQKLADRGLEVRVAHGKDAKGRPIYAGWNRQTTYRLPILLGDPGLSPVGTALGDPKRPPRRPKLNIQATQNDPLGDPGLSPFSSSPSGPSGPMTDNGQASPRPAPPRGEPPENQHPTAGARCRECGNRFDNSYHRNVCAKVPMECSPFSGSRKSSA